MMSHVDALSRAPVQGIKVSTWSTEEFQELQDLDEDISIVKNWIHAGKRPDDRPKDCTDTLSALYNNFSSLVLEDDVLFRRWTDSNNVERLQVVVPKYISAKVMQEVHAQIGHLGIHKTFEMLQRKFYWPGFHKDVEDFCKSCEVCAKNKTVPRPRSPMKPIKVEPLPFHMIGVDLIGPLKTTRQGNKYILTVIDYYTKYAEAEALPNQEAETVVRALEQIFARHGMQSVLLTDQGRNFESHLFTSMCRLFGIDKRRTTPYHPQTDGLCERFNGILKLLLRMRVDKEMDWDDQLPSALLAYRISKQESTGVSPFELMYGREPKVAFDVRGEGEIESKPIGGPAQYLAELKERHQHLKSLVVDRIEKAQEKQKRNYDSNYNTKKNKNFVVGEVVLLKNFRARGLDEKYLGPYRIVSVIEEDCEIESIENGKRKFVHANCSKPFSLADIAIENSTESDSLMDEENSDTEEIVVQKQNNEAAAVAKDVRNDERRYDLRRERRPPERYGTPVFKF